MALETQGIHVFKLVFTAGGEFPVVKVIGYRQLYVRSKLLGGVYDASLSSKGTPFDDEVLPMSETSKKKISVGKRRFTKTFTVSKGYMGLNSIKKLRRSAYGVRARPIIDPDFCYSQFMKLMFYEGYSHLYGQEAEEILEEDINESAEVEVVDGDAADLSPEVSGEEPEVSGEEPEVSGEEPEVSGEEPEVSGEEPEEKDQPAEEGEEVMFDIDYDSETALYTNNIAHYNNLDIFDSTFFLMALHANIKYHLNLNQKPARRPVLLDRSAFRCLVDCIGLSSAAKRAETCTDSAGVLKIYIITRYLSELSRAENFTEEDFTSAQKFSLMRLEYCSREFHFFLNEFFAAFRSFAKLPLKTLRLAVLHLLLRFSTSLGNYQLGFVDNKSADELPGDVSGEAERAQDEPADSATAPLEFSAFEEDSLFTEWGKAALKRRLLGIVNKLNQKKKNLLRRRAPVSKFGDKKTSRRSSLIARLLAPIMADEFAFKETRRSLIVHADLEGRRVGRRKTRGRGEVDAAATVSVYMREALLGHDACDLPSRPSSKSEAGTPEILAEYYKSV